MGVSALLWVPAPAHAVVPPPPSVPGTTVIPLGVGATNVIAADASSGTVLLRPPSGDGLQVRNAEGGLETTLLGSDKVSDLVFDPIARLFWAALPFARELASIDPVTLDTHRYAVPTEAGCPQNVAVSSGLVVFISPFAIGDGCSENAGYHALDPSTGTVHPSLARTTGGYPQRIAAAGGAIFYAAEDDYTDFLTTYVVVGGATPSITLSAKQDRSDWTRDLAVDPDTGNALVGGADNGHLVVTPSLSDAVVQPQGTYHQQVQVAAAPSGLMAFSPWAYGSKPGEADLYVYRDDASRPAAQYDLGRFSNSSDSDEIDALAFGRHLYALTDFWNGSDGHSYSYLRIFDLPAAPPTDPPSSDPLAFPTKLAKPRATVHGHRAVIRWRPPHYGGELITRYLVSVNGSERSVPSPRLRLVLRHLHAGRYVVRIAAVNAAGPGVASRSVRFRIADPPHR
jgi:hypothetical protein